MPDDTLTADEIVRLLELEPLPGEGGWFRETYRGPRDGGATRDCATHIHFLLRTGEVSAWHRVASDEVFHHYAGAPVEQLQVDLDAGHARRVVIGDDLAGGERPQVIVPAGWWQGARSLGDWSLLGCTVSPGFDWEDFALASVEDVARLARVAGEHVALVEALAPVVG